MGKLYDACQEVMRHIESSGLDIYMTRGAIALQTGFLISAVKEDAPDDPAQLQSLREAAREVLGIELHT